MATPTTNLPETHPNKKSAPALLVFGSLALWALTAIPATIYFDERSALMAGAAMLLCLIPGAITFFWAQSIGRRSPEMLMIVVLGGTMVRLTAALGGGVALYLTLPEYFPIAFWIWLSLFYLFTLAVEIYMLNQPR